MTFDFARYAQYLLLNPSGDGWIVSEDCPAEILAELRKANEEYTEFMGKPLLIFP